MFTQYLHKFPEINLCSAVSRVAVKPIAMLLVVLSCVAGSPFELLSQTDEKKLNYPVRSFTGTSESKHDGKHDGKHAENKHDENKVVDDDQFNGETAYEVLVWLCKLGPRISGTEAMKLQQDTLEDHFTKMGGKVTRQEFSVPHPVNRVDTKLTNLIVEWHPERDQRILICCHYDTRPYAEKDSRNPRGVFLGANDGASGVGLLYALGFHMKDLDTDFGVDFVFFDAEELVYDRSRDPLFVGSSYFANEYAKNPPEHTYRRGVLVDMVGDKDLQIYYETNSLYHAKELMHQIFASAKELGIKEFKRQNRHKIRDDHLPLNQIAKIPTCDIIDFDYPNPKSNNAYWHTMEDKPENCSAESLEKVGRVILHWLRKQENHN